MKKLLIMILKVAASAAIIGYLVYDATHGQKNQNVFENLCNQPKQWDMLAWAWAFCGAASLLTFIRWWLLVRSLDVPFRFRDSIRISFWGFLFNLAPLGIVGGDLVKVLMLGREHPQHRAKALASVLVDRVIGLYILFLFATTTILLTGFNKIPDLDIQHVCTAMFIITAVSTVGLIGVMWTGMTNGRVTSALGRIPRIGHHIQSLIDAVRMYNRKPMILLVASVMSVCVHFMFAVGCYCIAVGLPGNHLSLKQHFVVMPLSAAVQVIPVPVGPTEFALEYFYTNVPVEAGPAIAKGQGLVVALTYRLITILTALLGIPYYFGNRREMAEVMHEAETEQG